MTFTVEEIKRLRTRSGTRADSRVSRNYGGDDRGTIGWGDWRRDDWRNNRGGGSNSWGRCLGDLAGTIGDGESLACSGRVGLAISCDSLCEYVSHEVRGPRNRELVLEVDVEGENIRLLKGRKLSE